MASSEDEEVYSYLVELEQDSGDYNLGKMRDEILEEDEEDIRHTALHEGGHAVAMEVIGPGVFSVSLIPRVNDGDLNSRGHTCPLATSHEDATNPSEQAQAAVSLAGPVVSYRVGDEMYKEIVEDALRGEMVIGGDLVQAMESISSFKSPGQSEIGVLRKIWRDTYRFISGRMDEVRAIAEKLMDKHRKAIEDEWRHILPILDRKEVREIMNR